MAKHQKLFGTLNQIICSESKLIFYSKAMITFMYYNAQKLIHTGELYNTIKFKEILNRTFL